MYESQYKSAGPKAVLRVYWQHARKHPGLLALVIVGLIILQAATLAAPLFLRQFFNLLSTNTPNAQVIHQLITILTFVALVWFIRWTASRVEHVSNIYLDSKVMGDLFDTAFSYLIKHSYNFFISRFAGSLTHKVSKFVRSFEVLFDSIVTQFFPTFLFVAGAVTVLYMRNHVLGIALGVWSVCFVWFLIFISKTQHQKRVIRSQADTRLTGTLADAVSNHATVMLFSGVTHERSIFTGVVQAWRKATLDAWLSSAVAWSVIGLFMIGIEVGLLYGAILLWQQGLVTVGDFVLIQSYLFITFDRLVAVNMELRRFYDAFADAGEMVYMLETDHEIKDIRSAKKLVVQEGKIQFEHVRFYFNKQNPVLTDLTVTIAPGERVAIVGPSGAGKSTVTKLLMRFYDINDGSIIIDGQNIAEVTQDSLREAIAFVPQEPILFHRTLMENIRYGRRDASDEEVIEASKKANCGEFIAKLPLGFETYVGERGIKLSGGERQRVAIARAILKNAPILVLDEATSSLDSESEALIQNALGTLMQGKTVIVIAHRLSTIMQMDRIAVLQNGTVVAEGTHDELLRQEGLYQKLWSIQAGGFLPEQENEEEETTPNISDDEETDDIADDDEKR